MGPAEVEGDEIGVLQKKHWEIWILQNKTLQLHQCLHINKQGGPSVCCRVDVWFGKDRALHDLSM